jgi:hypothetical protein
VAAGAGLDAGLLVAGDHVFVGVERDTVERAGVVAEQAGGFDGELRIADEDPGLVLPGLDRVAGQDPADGRRRDCRDDAPVDGFSGQVRASPL